MNIECGTAGPKKPPGMMPHDPHHQDQVGMPGSGPLTSMWGIRDLRHAFPELEEVSFVKIDAAPGFQPRFFLGAWLG